MKINDNPRLITIGLLLNASCLLIGLCVQVQAQDHVRFPIPPQKLAAQEEAVVLIRQAAASMKLDNYAEAEDEARQANSFSYQAGIPDEYIAAALDAQGKDKEALQAYQALAASGQPRDLLPYAQQLLKSGQWAQALGVYNRALPLLPDVGIHPESPLVSHKDLMIANSQFSSDVPEPVALATALHIARGMVYNTSSSWIAESQDKEAMGEYEKALQLAPDNALANYFYGVGWQKLSPSDRAKFGTTQQAKAHLQKAEKTGKASVKAAAQKALKNAG
ncbi:MAG: hypothetical protein ACRYFS_09070 [Janthinobacterium lividum]